MTHTTEWRSAVRTLCLELQLVSGLKNIVGANAGTFSLMYGMAGGKGRQKGFCSNDLTKGVDGIERKD